MTHGIFKIPTVPLPKDIKQLPYPLSTFNGRTACPGRQEWPEEVDWFI